MRYSLKKKGQIEILIKSEVPLLTQAWPFQKDGVYLKEGTLWSWIKLHNKTPTIK